MTAPAHRDTDFLHTPRIQAVPAEVEYWFEYFEKNPNERYVSDGDPDVLVFPAALVEYVNSDVPAFEETTPDPGYRVMRLR